MGKWKVTTLKQFELAKAMGEAGVTKKVIGIAINKSVGSVTRMLKYDTIDKYHKAEREARYAYTTKVAPVVLSENTVQTEDTEPVVEQVSSRDMKLERIASALEQLVSAWNTAPVKKRLF